ncbi:MAG: glycosyltransferase 87 family protein [Bacteroidota bacterium]
MQNYSNHSNIFAVVNKFQHSNSNMVKVKDIFKRNKASIFLFIVLIVSFIIENINGRFWLNDFKVYYTAASRLFNGGTLYNEAFGLGSGYYKYSPFAAAFFIPFTFLPYKIAAIIYYFIIAYLIVQVLKMALYLTNIIAGKEIPMNQQSILLYVFLAGIVHLQRELHLGNVNILLLSILLFSLKKMLDGKMLLPAILLGLVILFKPHFIIFIPSLLLRKKFGIALQSMITVMVGLMIPSLFLGVHQNVELHSQWLQTMQTHNAGIIDARQTIYSILYQYLIQFFIPQPDKVYLLILLMMVGMAVSFFIVNHLINERAAKTSETINSNGHFISEFFLLLALVPSLTLTDSEHFLLSLPLITVLIYFLVNKGVSKMMASLIIMGLLFYGGNIHDLLGGKLSDLVETMGLLGVGNLVLIGLFYFVDVRNDL